MLYLIHDFIKIPYSSPLIIMHIFTSLFHSSISSLVTSVTFGWNYIAIWRFPLLFSFLILHSLPISFFWFIPFLCFYIPFPNIWICITWWHQHTWGVMSQCLSVCILWNFLWLSRTRKIFDHFWSIHYNLMVKACWSFSYS